LKIEIQRSLGLDTDDSSKINGIIIIRLKFCWKLYFIYITYTLDTYNCQFKETPRITNDLMS